MSQISLYDSKDRMAKALPAAPGPVRIYVCGPTVYQRAHVGNARPFIVFAWLRAWLVSLGYEVKFVHNVTDVNDKIYAAAPGASADLAKSATGWYIDDISALGLGLPDLMPRVSTSIPSIVEFIAGLIQKGHAYESDGDVYFRADSFPAYGALSGRQPDESEEGEHNPLKADQRDFALWKRTKLGEDTSWSSPWGQGRPGWHIECSAMALDSLGESFEIHGGGIDLLFPHHENELAQSASAGLGFAAIWMHNGMLEFSGEKMSKSLGNIRTLQDTLDEWGSEAILMLMLNAHWHSPLRFSDADMTAATVRIQRIREAFHTVAPAQRDEAEWNRMTEILGDNFNTPNALALVHEWLDAGQLDLARTFLTIFGLGSIAELAEPPTAVASLAEKRAVARASGRFEDADLLRQEIAKLGWGLRDSGPSTYNLFPTGRR